MDSIILLVDVHAWTLQSEMCCLPSSNFTMSHNLFVTQACAFSKRRCHSEELIRRHCHW